MAYCDLSKKLAVVDYGGIQVLFLRACVGLNLCVFLLWLQEAEHVIFVSVYSAIPKGKLGEITVSDM